MLLSARVTRVVAAAAAVLLLPFPARAWGNVGHAIACQIAYLELSPAARAQVDAILRAKTTPWGLHWRSLAFACTFPDNPHIHGDERHFVNVPRDTAKISGETCGANTTCLFTAMHDDSQKLADKTLANAARKEALANLGHWTGDLHQPLHVSFGDDRGGNSIKTTDVCADDYGATNLHSVWDRCLVQAPHGVTETDLKAHFPKIETVRQIADQLRATITASNRTKWRATEPAKWADESFQIAEKPDTQYCAKSNGSCKRKPGSVAAGQTYIDDHAKLVDERLKRAGVRLAKQIEDALH